MADSGQPRGGTRFVRRDVVATPALAAAIRQDFAAWLAEHFTLDRVRVSDIVLAVNEALANVVDAAYAHTPEPGAMHVYADYDQKSAVLTVIVADDGRWRPAATRDSNAVRGRGIPLMNALTDRTEIEPTDAGTRVCLQWNDITVLPSATV
ncbi:ATP-binding protein [Mycolicibacterium llatzerense]|uniref:Anti-sigma regulatory factor n=1 Tax=Mycolicibacterium llatzerense TaxID=280871 RepID=A0A0D1JUK9_9MYCO|nr:ATP-binding protein [Mycolicibacterium llatzerense]KIU16259.1 anti-sigma regulatory factor [Mycolicibacterium llatzerense]